MKNQKFILIIFLLFISCYTAYAQSKKKSKKKYEQEYDRGATYEVETSGKKRKKNTKYSLADEFDKKVDEFYERMDANARKYEKMAKEMEKPQYSDPSYFGHKRKPKKRPPGKKKFCKECSMYH